MLKTNILLCWVLLLSATTSLYAQPANDACADAIDITSTFIVGATDTLTAGPFDNIAATPGGIPDASCWFDGADNGSVWFTFTAAAGSYDIITNLTCAGIDPNNLNPDTQFLLYSGSCGNLTPVACNDDISGDNFLAGLFGVELEAGVTYYLAVDGWSNDMGAFFQGEFCIQVNLGNAFTCDDASAGTYILENTSPEICFNDTLFLTMTAPDFIPPLGGTGLDYFHWVVTSIDISDTTMSIYGDPAVFLAQFGQTAGAYDIIYINNPANGVAPGTYWFTPVISANATNTDGTFAGLDFSDGCFLAGQSTQITLLDSIGQLTVTIDVGLDPDMTMGGATATVNTSGGSGDYTYAWSTGDTTAVVDSLADGTYTVTISDANICVNDVVRTVNITNNPPSVCDDADAGQYVLESSADVCFNDTLQLTITSQDSIPPIDGEGLNYFHWVVTTADISDTTMSIYPDPTLFLGQFGQAADAYDITYVNNPANGLVPGPYWFTPVIAANAINTDGTFEGLDFSEGCFLAGTNIFCKPA